MTNIIVWLCLVTIGQQVYGKVITVNKNGNDSSLCCQSDACACSSLSKALLCTENNTVINITSQNISLTTSVSIGSGNISNITITGNHGTNVMCNDTGAVFCDMCSNVSIEGITWNQCGNISNPTSPGISFNTVSNISIRNCIFRHSKVCTAVSIADTVGPINVVNSTFKSNAMSDPSPCGKSYFSSTESYYSSLLITSSKSTVINILDSLFSHNGNEASYVSAGSFYYYGDYSQQSLKLLVNNTNFVSNDFSSMYIDDNSMMSLIIFDTVNISYNNWNVVVYARGDNSTLNIISSYFTDNNYGALDLSLNNGILNLNNTTFKSNTGSSIVYIDVDSGSTVNILQCNCNDNVGDDNILYISTYSEIYVPSDFCNILISSNFINNKNGPALQVSKCFLRFINSTLFQNNSADNGGAIYIEQNSQITVDDESTVQFIKNSASLRGGAMYIDLTSCYNDSIMVLTNFTKHHSISFIDNLAKLSGNSVYFNIPESCEVVRNGANNFSYIPFEFTYNCKSRETTGSAIATSPYGIKLCSLNSIQGMIDSNDKCGVNNGQSNRIGKCVNDIGKTSMLGQSIYFSTTLYDYFDGAAEAIMFQVKCDNCGTKFRLVGNRTLVHNELRGKVKFLSDEELKNDTNITLTLTSLLPPEYRQLTATLSLTLSSCYNGFSFSNQLQQCECYNEGDRHEELMECEGDSASIKLGYWFGDFNNKHTFSLCYHEYCELDRNETGNGYVNLPEEVDDQCSPHRTGVACGQCSEGYTLAYNSPDCISVEKCSPGMIVLVLVLTVLYWIAIVASLFGMAYYFNNKQMSLGYLYGIIFFYSIVDILLVTHLHRTDGVFYITTILSSFAKLNPQFLGKLCFIKNLDAIDQQFIHYCHMVFIAIILIGIVVVARCNKRAFFHIKHLIVPVICLLLLFSYTSLTSTSLLLLIPVNLGGKVHTFLSPHVKYLNDQHAAYASVAILCALLVTIGFPFLLVIEPCMMKVFNDHLNAHAPNKAKLQVESFMKKRITVRIKLLLDRLQDCYKDQYRWFAAYYLICRLVIMLITYFANDDYNNMIYYLQTACVVIAMTHIWIQPYKDDTLNVIDAVILLIMVLIVNLSVLRFTTSTTVGFAVSLIIAPLILLFAVAVKKLLLPKIKKFQSNHDVKFRTELTSVAR